MCDDVVDSGGFEEHERSHGISREGVSENQMMQCPVPECPLQFTHPDDLERHFNEDHDEAEMSRSAASTPLTVAPPPMPTQAPPVGAVPRVGGGGGEEASAVEHQCYKCPDMAFSSTEALQVCVGEFCKKNV